MKINNSKIINTIFFANLFICLLIFLSSLMMSSFWMRALLFSVSFIIIISLLFLKSYEFDESGAHLSITKKQPLTSAKYRTPCLEFPKQSLQDYMIEGRTMKYFLVLIMVSDSGKKRRLHIPLLFFEEKKVISIVKVLESIKIKNRLTEQNHVKDLLNLVQ